MMRGKSRNELHCHDDNNKRKRELVQGGRKREKSCLTIDACLRWPARCHSCSTLRGESPSQCRLEQDLEKKKMPKNKMTSTTEGRHRRGTKQKQLLNQERKIQTSFTSFDLCPRSKICQESIFKMSHTSSRTQTNPAEHRKKKNRKTERDEHLKAK